MKSICIYLSLLTLFLPLPGISGNNIGKIIKVKKDVFQIDYPNQIINIYFNYSPGESLEPLVSGIVISPEKELRIVETLRNEIDKLPPDFIGKFLGLEIYPMHILQETTAGFYSAGKIVLEISESKLYAMHDGNIQNSFLHEVAHHIYKQMEYRNETKAIIQFLKEEQKNNPVRFITKPTNKQTCMENGYVSLYSSGAITGSYDVGEEFAELFAYLICTDSRKELLNFTKSHPGFLLTEKIERFRFYLNEIIPSFNDDFFGYGSDHPVTASTGANNPTGQSLATHDEKSNEAPVTTEPDETSLAGIEMMQEEVAQEFSKESGAVEQAGTNPTSIHSTPRNHGTTKSAGHNTKQKKNRKSKKRKSEGWLLSALSIAILITAEFLL